MVVKLEDVDLIDLRKCISEFWFLGSTPWPHEPLCAHIPVLCSRVTWGTSRDVIWRENRGRGRLSPLRTPLMSPHLPECHLEGSQRGTAASLHHPCAFQAPEFPPAVLLKQKDWDGKWFPVTGKGTFSSCMCSPCWQDALCAGGRLWGTPAFLGFLFKTHKRCQVCRVLEALGSCRSSYNKQHWHIQHFNRGYFQIWLPNWVL